MQSIRILIPTHVTPETKSVTTLFFENLLPHLKQHVNVDMIWFVYMPDKLVESQKIFDDTTVIDIHNYNNALEVLQKYKPDLVYAHATYSFIDYSFSLASKHLGIPVIGGFYSDLQSLLLKRDRSKLIGSYVNRFFQNTIPTDTVKTKKQFMRRGRFYVYKYLFVLKTQIAIKMNPFKIFKIFIRTFSNILQSEKHFTYDPSLANTLHWLEGESLLEQLVSIGFKKSSLVVTGNPQYDFMFKKLKNYKSTKIKNDIIHVLLITDALYEHGFYSLKQRDEMFNSTIKELIKYKNEISLTVKIHPSSESFVEYKSLLEKIDSSINLYQKEDVIQLMENSDVLIAFSSYTSALLYALILKKPLLICNYSNIYEDIFLDKGVAYECKDPTLVYDMIKQVSKSNIPEDLINIFLKECIYNLDGCASKRLGDAILKLLHINELN